MMRRLLAVTLCAGATTACASRPPQAVLDPHQPEPVAPYMMPVATVPAPTLRDRIRYTVDSVVAAPMWRNARLGILIVDPESGDTLASHDADRLFMPASNQKLLTGAIATTLLGPDFRWRTPVLLHGVQRGSTWHGNVYLQGSGDPSISDALRGGRASSAFDAALEALSARGVRRIAGRVLPVGDALPGLSTGYGWAWDDFDAAYSAAIDELMYNEGELYITVHAGRRVGAPVRVQTAPTRRYPSVVVDAVTRDSTPLPAGTRPPRLQAAYDSIGRALIVSGTLAPGDSARLTVAYRHPNDAFVAAFTESLAERGITVQQKRLARRDTASRAIDTLAVITSPPFADVLRRMEKPSQNQMAELFFRTVALQQTGSGSADSAQAVGARALAAWGVTANDAAYRDGSGLSRHDYVTPRAIVKVLDAMRRSPHDMLFRDALPIAGVDGTIRSRMRGTPAEGNVRAKTGTLDKARALSGYVTTANGRVLLFSMMMNNFTVPTREVERVQDLLAAMLAGGTLVAGSGS
jgi:D-alanyl-D-alanine carboxypeptidase/D-alanyl-D-alanine-endopeptidase (penicillin-binding protein 4)